MIIFNSDDNYSKNLMLEFNDVLVKIDNLYIRKIGLKNVQFYTEVDCDIYDVLEIEKMQNIVNQKIKTVKIYPDFGNINTFFVLDIISFLEFDTESKNFKIYCKNKCRIEKDGNVIEDFNESFLEFTTLGLCSDRNVLWWRGIALFTQTAEHLTLARWQALTWEVTADLLIR